MGRERPTRVTVLVHPTYRGFYLASAALFANGAMFELLLIWSVLSLTGSAVWVGVAVALNDLPVIAAGIVGPERLMLGRSLGLSAAVMAAALLVAVPLVAERPLALAAWLAVGVVQGWFQSQLVPMLQTRLMTHQAGEGLPERSAAFEVASRVGMVAGPAAAGALLASAGAPSALAATAAVELFAAVALALSPLGKLAQRAAAAPDASRPRPRLTASLRESLALIRERPWLTMALTVRGLNNLLWPAFTLGVPIMALSTWHGGAGGYGVLKSVWSLTTVVSALVFSGALVVRRLRSAYFVSWVVSGAGFMALAAAPTMAWAIGAAIFGALGSPLVHIALDTEIGTNIPHARQGHVFALQRLVMASLGIAGLLALGPVEQGVGAGPLLGGAGALMVVAAAVALTWHRRQSPVETPA